MADEGGSSEPTRHSEDEDTLRGGMERLSALADQLATAQRADEVLVRAEQALAALLGPGAATVESAPTSHCGGWVTMAVPGSPTARISAHPALSPASLALVETTARLAGLALQRLEAQEARSRAEDECAALSRQILEEAGQERGRIATRIHDEVLPHLAAATIQADNIRTAASAGELERVGDLASRTHHAVHDGIASLREVLDDLQHESVVPGRLREALEESVGELRLKERVKTRLDAPPVLPALPFAVELLILETVRGCLANVARHARASSVVVSLAVKDCHVAVEVRDDGCGFDVQQTLHGHGLALMEQRVQMAKGRFAVRSAPGEGTTVTMEVPR